jgi:PAS domain S-box-containing protein
MKRKKSTPDKQTATRSRKSRKKQSKTEKMYAGRFPRAKKPASTKASLEITDLRLRLSEAEEMLSAIRTGEIDALVVSSPQGEQIYTLKGAEQPYRILVESINEGTLSLTADGIIINCNKAFSKIARTPCGTLIGTLFKDVVSKKDKKKFEGFWEQALAFETKSELELSFNGRTVPVYVSANARMQEGECWVFLVVADISERKRIEAQLARYRLHLERMVEEKTLQLQATNEKLQITNNEHIATNEKLAARTAEFEAIIDSMSDAVIYTDSQRRIRLVNRAMTAMFGYTQEELNGKSCNLLYDDKRDFERMGELLYRPLLGNNRLSYEVRYRCKDGATFLGESRSSQIRDAKGSSIGYIGIHRDITERRKAEEKLAKLNEDLNRQNAKLAALNKELEAFSFAVSHDLRAPLRHIEGFIRILAEDHAEKLDETGRDHIRRVQAGAEKMKNLIDALLRLSRLTRGELNLSKVYLSTLGKTLANEITKTRPERRVEFVIAEDISAMGDHNMLRVLIDNLIGNAWKFTEKRSDARIEFGATRVDGKDVYFVKDNGAGFDMKFSEKMFMPFQRLHSESEFPGLGIGLSIVQRIVQRHGGRIWAEGEVGKGAAFYFTLN